MSKDIFLSEKHYLVLSFRDFVDLAPPATMHTTTAAAVQATKPIDAPRGVRHQPSYVPMTTHLPQQELTHHQSQPQLQQVSFSRYGTDESRAKEAGLHADEIRDETHHSLNSLHKHPNFPHLIFNLVLLLKSPSLVRMEGWRLHRVNLAGPNMNRKHHMIMSKCLRITRRSAIKSQTGSHGLTKFKFPDSTRSNFRLEHYLILLFYQIFHCRVFVL